MVSPFYCCPAKIHITKWLTFNRFLQIVIEVVSASLCQLPVSFPGREDFYGDFIGQWDNFEEWCKLTN